MKLYNKLKHNKDPEKNNVRCMGKFIVVITDDDLNVTVEILEIWKAKVDRENGTVVKQEYYDAITRILPKANQQ